MNSNLLLAILAMDSFNQGYAPGLEGDRPVIGPATRIDIPTPDSWKTIGFYAVAYRLTQAVGDLAAGVAMR